MPQADVNDSTLSRALLRAEGMALAAVSIAAYAVLGGGWAFFLVLILVPDLSMLAYLKGARTGAFIYNAMHSAVGLALLALVGLALGPTLLLSLALIWSAHIGFDRALGYGLKSAAGFSVTHLGRIGQRRPD